MDEQAMFSDIGAEGELFVRYGKVSVLSSCACSATERAAYSPSIKCQNSVG